MSFKTLFAFCFLFTTLLFATSSFGQNCQISSSQLRDLRLDALKRWTERVNQDAIYYLGIVSELMTEDHHSRLAQMGTFGPKPVAIEYGLLLFMAPAGSPPATTLKHRFDPTSVVWDSENQLRHTFTMNITSGWNGTAYTTFFDGVRQSETIIFEECTQRIARSYLVNDFDAQKIYDRTAANTPREVLCTLNLMACPVGSIYEQYSSFEDCMAFMTAIPDKSVCPWQYASNTTACRVIHTLTAFIDPAIHCPHTGRNSVPCRDTCLPACSNCHPNAECRAIVSNNAIDLNFQCRCKDSYTGDGINTCTPNTCTAQYQCATVANYNSVTCPSSGLCTCAASYNWNSTQAAANKKSACECPEGWSTIYRNGVSECLQRGRCYERWQCPQKYNQVTCIPYGSNPFHTWGSCICNYGFDNLGFEQDCRCSAPKRVVWSNAFNGEVCLAPNECTENYHCGGGGRCTGTSPGNPVGQCA